jgi:hypothetical protein
MIERQHDPRGNILRARLASPASLRGALGLSDTDHPFDVLIAEDLQ